MMISPYEVIFPDYDEGWPNAKTFLAREPEIAAQNAVAERQWQSAEYPPETLVLVRPANSVRATAYRVTMETVPVYTAKRITP